MAGVNRIKKRSFLDLKKTEGERKSATQTPPLKKAELERIRKRPRPKFLFFFG